MSSDSLPDGIGEEGSVTPDGIAHNGLFTPKEKIELLTQLKADATVAQQEGRDMAFDLNDIEQAIAAVHQDVQDGVGTETPIRGDL